MEKYCLADVGAYHVPIFLLMQDFNERTATRSHVCT